MKIAKGIFPMSDERESKLEPVPPCLLPVHNPSLEPEHYKGPGWGLGWIRVPCAPCGVQYDIREVEHYGHPSARCALRVPQGSHPGSAAGLAAGAGASAGESRLGRARLCPRSRRSSITC